MGEAAWPAEPTRGQTARASQALAQHGGIVALYGSGCYDVTLAMQ
jgi:hypothetical protein